MKIKFITLTIPLLFLFACAKTETIDVNKEPSNPPKTNICGTFSSGVLLKSPEEMKEYFSKIEYEKEAPKDSLILMDISPELFKTPNTKLKKEMFFKSIYPLAIKVNKEILEERKQLKKGKDLENLFTKYKTTELEELDKRINIIPASMLMAQSAIESGYGTSRFAIEGNALFGQWTKGKGIVPKEKPNSIWKVASYDTPLDSARSYALNINTHKTYSELRNLRHQGLNPINGLSKYSQKGTFYVDILNSIIKSNNLTNYDIK